MISLLVRAVVLGLGLGFVVVGGPWASSTGRTEEQRAAELFQRVESHPEGAARDEALYQGVTELKGAHYYEQAARMAVDPAIKIRILKRGIKHARDFHQVTGLAQQAPTAESRDKVLLGGVHRANDVEQLATLTGLASSPATAAKLAKTYDRVQLFHRLTLNCFRR